MFCYAYLVKMLYKKRKIDKECWAFKERWIEKQFLLICSTWGCVFDCHGGGVVQSAQQPMVHHQWSQISMVWSLNGKSSGCLVRASVTELKLHITSEDPAQQEPENRPCLACCHPNGEFHKSQRTQPFAVWGSFITNNITHSMPWGLNNEVRWLSWAALVKGFFELCTEIVPFVASDGEGGARPGSHIFRVTGHSNWFTVFTQLEEDFALLLFTVKTSDVPEELQMELIKLQGSTALKDNRCWFGILLLVAPPP